MANYKHTGQVWLFVSQTPHTFIGQDKTWLWTGVVAHDVEIPGSPLCYNYDPRLRRLTIYNRNGEKLYDRHCYYGSAFEVLRPNSPRPVVRTLRYPHAREKAIPWLCGFFNHQTRTDSFWRFHQATRKNKDLTVKRFGCHRFAFLQEGNRPAISFVRPQRLNEATARKILRECCISHFPVEFVERVLSSVYIDDQAKVA